MDTDYQIEAKPSVSPYGSIKKQRRIGLPPGIQALNLSFAIYMLQYGSSQTKVRTALIWKSFDRAVWLPHVCKHVTKT